MAVVRFPYGRSEPYTPAGALMSTAGTARTAVERPELATICPTPAVGHHLTGRS